MDVLNKAIQKIQEDKSYKGFDQALHNPAIPDTVKDHIKKMVQNPYQYFIYNGAYYQICREPTTEAEYRAEKRELGFSGTRFVVHFPNGTQIVTHNLFYGGHFHESLLEMYPPMYVATKVEGLR